MCLRRNGPAIQPAHRPPLRRVRTGARRGPLGVLPPPSAPASDPLPSISSVCVCAACDVSAACVAPSASARTSAGLPSVTPSARRRSPSAVSYPWCQYACSLVPARPCSCSVKTSECSLFSQASSLSRCFSTCETRSLSGSGRAGRGPPRWPWSWPWFWVPGPAPGAAGCRRFRWISGDSAVSCAPRDLDTVGVVGSNPIAPTPRPPCGAPESAPRLPPCGAPESAPRRDT
jgi:hypothetical protein